jgi:hypothetical protein
MRIPLAANLFLQNQIITAQQLLNPFVVYEGFDFNPLPFSPIESSTCLIQCFNLSMSSDECRFEPIPFDSDFVPEFLIFKIPNGLLENAAKIYRGFLTDAPMDSIEMIHEASFLYPQATEEEKTRHINQTCGKPENGKPTICDACIYRTNAQMALFKFFSNVDSLDDATRDRFERISTIITICITARELKCPKESRPASTARSDSRTPKPPSRPETPPAPPGLNPNATFSPIRA